jgi:hypothetical protein
MKQDRELTKTGNIGKPHAWEFVRLGGFDQVRLKSGADCLAIETLDQKLWTALSCPAQGLEFDEKTLKLLDTDGDGRIRVPEVIAAIKWTGSLLKNPDDLLTGSDTLPLSAIKDSTVEGQEIVASAKQILINLGQPDVKVVAIKDTADTAQIFANTKFNGDGVICPSSAEDEVQAKVIQDIIDCIGSEMDRSGQPGITEEKLELFFSEAEAYSDWWHQAEEDAADILPFGENTENAAAVFHAVKAKIDDFYIRSRLAAYDPVAKEPLNPNPEGYQALSAVSLSTSTDQIAALPIARIGPEAKLPLQSGINPAWAESVAQLCSQIIKPLIGDRTHLAMEEWESISAKFSAMEAWLSIKKGSLVERLGLARVREILQGHYKEAITDLLQRDKALEPHANAIDNVDRLVHYHRDLYKLLNNFISFRDFYTPDRMAIFQAGTLYLDGRSCELCVKVDDIEKHSLLATLSRTFLTYCECRRRGGQEIMRIAAAFTDGDSDNLRVGRNGVFYDRKGQDWDATIVKIVEHPISIRQAFWGPYKRVARMIGEQIEKFAASREKAVDESAAKGISDASAKVEAPKPAPAAPFDVARFAGIFAAIGLAIGAIGTALAAVVTGFMTLSWWQMPIALAGIILLISGPSMIIAWLKLRQRNLAPILDACGWAINTRAKINIPFGTSLTAVAKLPEGARQSVDDPFAEKSGGWKIWVILAAVLIALALLWNKGFFSRGSDPVKPEQTVVSPQETPKAESPVAPADKSAQPETK